MLVIVTALCGVMQDFEAEVGSLQEDMEAKMDNDSYKREKRQLDMWRDETDTALKVPHCDSNQV